MEKTNSIYELLQNRKKKGVKSLALLLDPDDISLEAATALAKEAQAQGVDFLLVGGSLIFNQEVENLIRTLKKAASLPVLLFPSQAWQISGQADAILFLSLLSSRNAELLIGQQVVAAPLLKNLEKKEALEIISTAYLLIFCGNLTTATYMSQALPIPYEKDSVALATALAGELLGFKMVYLDGGSGAARPISPSMIQAVATQVGIPIWVGGGIRTAQDLRAAYQAGADVAVVGTSVEENPALLGLFTEAKNSYNAFPQTP
ncbi:geranylgeranylglyceryl/heptaprenylglyceryl phosphate synthase [Hugenholtzia roseola]|uniref:geranylgeranylglyceryl/heptaprenylglyceryl phosphate synthase n=1 Tax=Hugenholtzia roseola TaxID=1002 RepID=UPI0004282B8E|nr:geranylgeranylglyceryl/heptaprenylglyceryl phosphate synthase [Hugenholtzia roseola]